jgi:arylsulfatase
LSEERPNIIFIITDQQRYDTISALGFPHVDTPNLDRLVREGVSFDRAYVTAPSCAPSRASLFNGSFPHDTGVYKNEERWPGSWVELLAASGYHCVNVGKMHTSPHEDPVGFHERFVVENKDRYYPIVPFYFDEWDKALRTRGLKKPGRATYREMDDYRERLGAFEWELPEEMHPDFFVGDLARWWVENHPKEEPLFLQVGFPGPHPPYDPIRRYAEPYMDRELPLPAVSEEDLDGQPPPMEALRHHHTERDHDAIVHLLDPTEEQLHRQRAYYLANVTMIDEKIGDLLHSLEKRGYLEDSIVIFCSDHGDCLGDHAHSQKWNMYEETVHVPAIVWAPGRVSGGRRVEELVQLMDLGPTVLELAGVEVPEAMEARSLVPALEGRQFDGRRYVFSEHSRDGVLRETAFMTMVRDNRWKLVHFVDSPGELFDLTEDPGETRNLWDDPARSEKKRELLDALLEWRIRSGLPAAGLEVRGFPEG